MASVINTNMASLYAQKNLSGAQNALSTSVERLSSGLRINRAKDDAAGLGISEKIKSQVTSLNQGLRNANDAISMVQTAEGSLSEVSSILQRMKELSVQARNDSLSTTQRSFISDELVALKNEINSIAERTTFNDLSLLKNALRTQVAVPAATDATKLVNGASLLDGISVSNLAVKNTNAGTYTITTGTQTPIANQVSEAAGDFGGQNLNVITIARTSNAWAQNDVVSATVSITGGQTITASYTVSATDDDNTSVDVNGANNFIASGLAAALNLASQAATGKALGITAVDNKIYIGGSSDNVSLTTTLNVTSAAAGQNVSVASDSLNLAERRIYINSEDAVEGNKFVLTIGAKEYSVVAGYKSSADSIRNQVAKDFETLLIKDYAAGANGVLQVDNTGSTDNTGQIKLAAALALGTADISLRVVRLADGNAVTNQASTVSAPSLTSTTANRTITLNDFDIVEGRKATIRVGNPEYFTEFSTVVGASDTKVTVASRLATLMNATHGGTAVGASAGVNDHVITVTGSTAPLGMSDISLTFNEMVEGADVSASSRVTAKNTARADRTITINQFDLTPGNVVSVQVGQKEYAVKVGASDSATDVAYRLSSLIDDDYARVAGTVSSSTATFVSVSNFAAGKFSAAGSATATFGTGMSAGDSVSIAGLTFTARRNLTAAEVAAAWSGLGAAATSGAGASYGDYSGALATGLTTTAATSTTVTFNASAAVNLSLASTAGDAVVRRVNSGVYNTGNVITIGAGSELGLEDISVSVKKITDPGKITITANNDTSIGGTSQSIDVGTIAAGASKSFDFDNLGVSFTLNNSRSTTVNAASFEAFTPKVNTLAVEAAMDGEALFQVGAGTRDNVILDGFKDIRVTGQNQNVGAEKEVFDKIHETLTTISANTTESLSEANFATLENRIEDAITMVSDFRSYFGGQQNRIEFAIANIQAQSENLTAANSRIVDTDYAAETANLTKTQIMQQAATAMLAQANQMPNVILALLK
ncbi:MAG: hypothetical protein FGM18_04950 [Burkholderiaceae bacterium]|nr:hypothetical protein [Burkholderiaceae bacterium]